MILNNLRFAHFIKHRQYVYPSKIIKKRRQAPNLQLLRMGMKGV